MGMNPAINKGAVSVFLGKEIEEISGRFASFEISRRALTRAVEEKEISVTADMKAKAEEVKKLLEGRNDNKKKEILDNLPDEDKEALEKVQEFENQKKTLKDVTKNIEPVVDFLEVAQNFKKEVDAEIASEGMKSTASEAGAVAEEKTAE